jgi:hypothetical protein
MSLTEDDKKWITERLERVETSLLTEFHKWASPIDAAYPFGHAPGNRSGDRAKWTTVLKSSNHPKPEI